MFIRLCSDTKRITPVQLLNEVDVQCGFPLFISVCNDVSNMGTKFHFGDEGTRVLLKENYSGKTRTPDLCRVPKDVPIIFTPVL